MTDSKAYYEEWNQIILRKNGPTDSLVKWVKVKLPLFSKTLDHKYDRMRVFTPPQSPAGTSPSSDPAQSSWLMELVMKADRLGN